MENPIGIDVIILSYAKNDMLKQTTLAGIESLMASEDPAKIRFNVIVIESNHDLKAYQYPSSETIYSNKKFGYHRYMNIGIKHSGNPYICLCNNDLIFHKNWASEILRAFEEDPTLDSASPICSIHHPPYGVPLNSGVHIGYEVRKEVTGWCLFLKRDILKKTGLLDEQFSFWYADNDYAKTLEQYHIKHALVTTSIVDHMESKTLKTLDQEAQLKITARERFYYEYKWEGRSYLSYLNRLLKFKREMKKQSRLRFPKH
ncbi:MAG: glycosyltransferase [Pedobacter sp.]|nr:glycosyltransferase [Pedobacter sp.]MDQ8052712.1 glycosyltransferase [Pedobacter sp.]